MNIAALPSNAAAVAGTSAFAGAGLWHIVRPYAQPYIDKAVAAFPAWLAARVKAQFDADVKSGKIPARAARLLTALKRAAVDWANDELDGGTDDEKVDAIVADLSHVPGLGKLVAADPDDVRAELLIEIGAVKAELSAEKAARAAADAARLKKPDAAAPAPAPNAPSAASTAP